MASHKPADPKPTDLVITPRDRRFARNEAKKRWWLGHDPVATAFFNVLSITFPYGEAFFIESVRAFRKGTPPALEREIAAFIKQENLHTREHLAFNRHVTDHGYDVSRVEHNAKALIEWVRGRSEMDCLTATMALEHFTAILAHVMLRDRYYMDGADADTANLWLWHATEEIEHKGVAYDTWMHATRDWSAFRRWRNRSWIMLLVTARFLKHRTQDNLDLLRQDGLSGPRVWWRLFRYAFGTPGIMRKTGGAWLSFFSPRFHPWEVDDRELITRFESEGALAAA